MSPTTMSVTGSCMTCAPRTTWNFCSCSMRLCKPRNCFSFDQSLKAVTSTTHTTDSRMAAPSIQPASPSPSSPPAASPQAADWRERVHGNQCYSKGYSKGKNTHTHTGILMQTQVWFEEQQFISQPDFDASMKWLRDISAPPKGWENASRPTGKVCYLSNQKSMTA